MKKSAKATVAPKPSDRIISAAFWLSLSLLVLIPLIFSTAVYSTYSLPKFALLIVGSALLLPLIGLSALDRSRRQRLCFKSLASRHVLIVCLYVICILISTFLGSAPVASLFGSSYNKMGLITYLCFFLCFIGLTVAAGSSELRFRQLLWAMVATGLVVATYAYVQFFGRDPLLPARLYTYQFAGGEVVRVVSTIGHSNYLGNFLLYTTLLTVGLAIAARGQARRFAVVAAVVSTVAIAFSGTRGAWLGYGAGASLFVALMIRDAKVKLLEASRRLWIIRAIIASAIIVAAIILISSNPAVRNITARARAFATEGFTGAGRTLLWRDALRMAPDYALVGCGPEGFRKAFLAYRSKELAQLAPQTNNESSHSSYLDASISYGLPGAIAYAAVIASTLALLFRARHRAASRGLRVIITGLMSSFTAVIVHNFFIFDQIPTGLYFFAFASLAIVAMKVASNAESKEGSNPAGEIADAKDGSGRAARASFRPRQPARATVAVCSVAPLVAVWYALALVRADVAINKAFDAASKLDIEQVIAQGQSAIAAPDPAGDYDFSFARVLALSAERIQAAVGTDSQSRGHLMEQRNQVIDLAIKHAEASLAHTLTPDSSHLLLAYLSLIKDDAARLRVHAEEAVRLDPNYSNARWLMAEAYLAEGDREQAVREAEIALEINPSLREARLLLRRVRGRAYNLPPEELIEWARALAVEGKITKARRLLARAIRKSNGICPDCHRELAIIYETIESYENAIAEWRVYLQQSPDRASAEQINLRIESLGHKLTESRARN